MINRQLTDKGSSTYSLRSYSSSSFVDVNYPTKGPVKTYTDYSLKAFASDYLSSQIDGTLVKIGDIKLFVDPTNMTVTPKTDDLIISGSEQWKVKSVKKNVVDTTIVLYTLQLRR